MMHAILVLAATAVQSEADLAATLERLRTGFVADRVAAANTLQRWVSRPAEGAEGFSDKSVDRPKVAPALSNELYDKAVTALAEAANDPEARIREAASQALAMTYGRRPAVQAALLRALKSGDPTVTGYVLQAFDRVRPEPEAAVPILAGLLDSFEKDPYAVAYALKPYGPKAKDAVPALLRLATRGSDIGSGAALSALAEIGVTKEQAASLAAFKFKPKEELDFSVFHVLIPFPDLATAYLNDRPKLFGSERVDDEILFRIVETTDATSEILRKAVLERSDLPSSVMAWSLDPRFLPVLRERRKKAHKHRATFEAACARACGDPADRVVNLSEKEPGDFKPKSAWPGKDPARSSKGGGHGDGFTPVLITGILRMADGSIPAAPRFINENDRMLLGHRTDDPGPLRFDPKSGRFVFYTTVFAAYQRGEEPGPYQTGSAQVRIESGTGKPLVVRFYDEMPDVKITLAPAR